MAMLIFAEGTVQAPGWTWIRTIASRPRPGRVSRQSLITSIALNGGTFHNLYSALGALVARHACRMSGRLANLWRRS